MGRPMGIQMGLDVGIYCKRKFRWFFAIPQVSEGTVSALPPQKSARPHLMFKEMSVRHLIEDVYYPAKPDWKPLQVTLYDLKHEQNIIFEWIKEFYRPSKGELDFPNQIRNQNAGFIVECRLDLYDGCGNLVERWVYEDCWPQSINFQNLDMADSQVCVADLVIRYARAYVQDLRPPSDFEIEPTSRRPLPSI